MIWHDKHCTACRKQPWRLKITCIKQLSGSLYCFKLDGNQQNHSGAHNESTRFNTLRSPGVKEANNKIRRSSCVRSGTSLTSEDENNSHWHENKNKTGMFYLNLNLTGPYGNQAFIFHLSLCSFHECPFRKRHVSDVLHSIHQLGEPTWRLVLHIFYL